MADACTAPHPEGPRPAVAEGLCEGHYRRKLRGRPTGTPLRSGPALVQLPGVRVPVEVMRALERAAQGRTSTLSVGEQVRRVLEDWARR